MQWIVPLASVARRRPSDDPRVVGGKAAGLAWLLRHGFAVPDGWVVLADAFEMQLRDLPPSCEPRALLRAVGSKSSHTRAAEARDQILGAPLPSGLTVELEELWAAESQTARWGLAVRSSATCEDGAMVSMAGIAESRLGVCGVDALADAIKHVWASLAQGRALAYLAARGIRDVGMAVVIQRMVEARSAGVMFTRSPDAPASRRERIINVALGLGSPVVDGTATPDVLRIDERGRVVDAMIAQKEKQLVSKEGVLQWEDVAFSAPALSEERIHDLAEIALRLEKVEDVAWDVEFACDDARVWIVQARAATGAGFPEGGDAQTIWSSVNVGEALPGVATPLTWSVAGTFSEAGFRKAFSTLGCRVPRNATLVANVHGRFYLNLTQFMRIASQVPWLDARTLVELGGGAGADELATQVADVSHRGFYARLPLTVARLLREQVRLDEDVHAFEEWAERQMRLHVALDLAILPDEALARKLLDVEAMLEKTGTVMLTCASSALGSHLALKTLVSRIAPLGADRLAQALTGGIRDLETARPAIGLMRVVAIAQADPPARAAIAAGGGLEAIPDGPTRRALASFLDLYGDRALREAELSTPRWREDPTPVLTMIRVALRGEAREVEAAVLRARATADSELQKILPRLSVVEQTALRHLVARAQKASRLRERMRGWVTRVLGVIRQVALDADRRLVRLMPELSAEPRPPSQRNIDPVFLLTVAEIISILRGARTDMVSLVRARRAELVRDLARPDPPATFTGRPLILTLPPPSADALRGLPASGGVVEGTVRVVMGPSEIGKVMPGDILVTHTTDVGWTPLFLVAAGIVTELGGPLSHAAVVARELGVPAVVNVTSATRALRSGERVRVDGDRGLVERIK